MGTIKRGILGGFSGSVGGVVGSSWKGIAVVKAKPLSVANPQTTDQTNNRTQFKSAVLTASILLSGFVKPIWDRLAQFQSGYNKFVAANKDAFSTSGVLDVTKFVASIGKLAETVISSVVAADNDDEVTVNWVDDSGSNSKLITDQAYAVCYNATQDVWGISSAEATRDDATTIITMPAVMETGDVYSVWLCFKSANGLNIFKGSGELSNTVQ